VVDVNGVSVSGVSRKRSLLIVSVRRRMWRIFVGVGVAMGCCSCY